MFSCAFNLSPHGILIISLDEEKLLNVNERFLTLTGYSLSELSGISLSRIKIFMNERDHSAILDGLKKDGLVRDHEIEYKTKKNSVKYGVLSAEVIEIDNKQCAIISISDITERVHLEQEIMKISENERQKIGRDLHDDLGPHLIGIEVLSTVLKTSLNDRPDEIQGIDKIRQLIQEAITKTRGYARGLCPVYLMDHGLESALQELARNTEILYDIPCSFQYNNTGHSVNNTNATHLFRIAQEAIQNVIKHAQASHIEIELITDDNTLTLTVKDDGQGIQNLLKSHGMGMRIMNYRTRMIGGTIQIVPGKK